jgi:hypothetical protein
MEELIQQLLKRPADVEMMYCNGFTEFDAGEFVTFHGKPRIIDRVGERGEAYLRTLTWKDWIRYHWLKWTR